MIDVIVEEHRIGALRLLELAVDHRQVIVRRSEPMTLQLVETATCTDFPSVTQPTLRKCLPLLGLLNVVARAERLEVEELSVEVVEERFDVRLAVEQRVDVVGAPGECRAWPHRGVGEQAVCDGSDQPGDDDRSRTERRDLQTLTVSAELRGIRFFTWQKMCRYECLPKGTRR